MFVTVWIAVLNLATGKLVFTNAGHNPPLIRRASGEVEEIADRHGPILGVMEGKEYGESTMEMAQGDVLLVYTDGVTEAMDRDDNLYGDDRLLELLQSMNEGSAKQMLGGVRASVDEFAEGAEQADDITMVAIRYNG